jgi:hypothetical protein
LQIVAVVQSAYHNVQYRSEILYRQDLPPSKLGFPVLISKSQSPSDLSGLHAKIQSKVGTLCCNKFCGQKLVHGVRQSRGYSPLRIILGVLLACRADGAVLDCNHEGVKRVGQTVRSFFALRLRCDTSRVSISRTLRYTLLVRLCSVKARISKPSRHLT